MIIKSHLRIGNYVQRGNMVFVIENVDMDSVIVKQLWAEKNTGTFTFEEIEGVPITPAILRKHKWVEEGSGYFVFTGNHPAELGGIPGLLDIEYPWSGYPQARVWTFQDREKEDRRGAATVLQYFHELQNLVFGITTKELAELIE